MPSPFIKELTEDGGPQTDFEKWSSRLGSATGLNAKDINIAVEQPKKVAYLEQTIRAMEQGTLKIRVRSLENEQVRLPYMAAPAPPKMEAPAPYHHTRSLPSHPLVPCSQALARMALSQQVTNKLLVAALLLNVGLAGATAIPAAAWLVGAGVFGAQAGASALSIKVFDKKAARYESKDFGDAEVVEAKAE